MSQRLALMAITSIFQKSYSVPLLADLGLSMSRRIHQAEASMAHFVRPKNENRPDSSLVYNM
jgi:hypothetical protein